MKLFLVALQSLAGYSTNQHAYLRRNMEKSPFEESERTCNPPHHGNGARGAI